MKSRFREYYQLSKAELKALWRDATISLDANALLDIFRYSDTTATTFLKTLESTKPRLWLTHQAAAEYHSNLAEVLAQGAQECRNALSQMETLVRQLTAATTQKRRTRPHLKDTLLEELKAVTGKLKTEIEKEENQLLEQMKTHPLKDDVARLFEGRVGARPEEQMLAGWYAEARSRYEKKQPPGFSDGKKPEPARYGDLVLWKQLLQKAATDKKDVILITNDKKEDWFQEKEGRTLGPLPALIAEFREATEHTFYAYSVAQFLELAATQLNADVPETAIKEARLNRHTEHPQPLSEALQHQLRMHQMLVANFAESEREQRRQRDQAAWASAILAQTNSESVTCPPISGHS